MDIKLGTLGLAVFGASLVVAESAFASTTLTYKPDSGAYHVNGDTLVRVGETVDITVESSDPRSIWYVNVNHVDPTSEDLSSALDLVLTVASGGAGGLAVSGINSSHPREAALITGLAEWLRAYVTSPLTDDSSVAQLQAKSDEVDALRASILAAIEQAADEPTKQGWRDLIVKLQPVVSAYAVASRVASRAEASRSHSASILASFEGVTIEVCNASLVFDGDTLQLSDKSCTSPAMRLDVLDPGGFASIGAGLAIPLYLSDRRVYFNGEDDAGNSTMESADDTQRVGQPIPIVSVEARHLWSERSRPYIGVQGLLALDDKLFDTFGVGVSGGVYGLSLGIGALYSASGQNRQIPGVDSTDLAVAVESVPRGGLYVSIGIGSDLFRVLRSTRSNNSTATTTEKPTDDESGDEDSGDTTEDE